MGKALRVLGIGMLTLAVACSENATTRPAPAPPTVSTGGALSVGRVQAAVSGVLDPHGIDTVYWFEYGPTDLYGIRTPETQASDATSGNREVGASLTGLIPSTDYHYRLSARNSGGTAIGDDRTLHTLDPNQPPNTHLTSAPADTLDATVRWRLFWFGTDTDGSVVSFELRVADHGPDGVLDVADSLGVRWTRTGRMDTLLTRDEGLGNRTAWVRAIDDEGARDPSPASKTIVAID